MKKVISVLLIISLLAVGCCSCAPAAQVKKDKLVVASFYPVYIFTLNLVDGIADIRVESMAGQNIGCLHDYTLTAGDAKLLNDADIFVINGAGMESFIEDAMESAENLKVVDSSAGIELLCSHHHLEEAEPDEHQHNHAENSHIWLSVSNAKKQVENIKDGLTENFPEYEGKIEQNYESYIARLNALFEKRDEFSKEIKGEKVISFHGAYEYMATECGFHIAQTIETDEGGEPSAKALGELCRKIKEENIKAIFIEPEYEGSGAEILSNETNVKIYEINPVIKGEAVLDAYEKTMLQNYETVLKAVK